MPRAREIHGRVSSVWPDGPFRTTEVAFAKMLKALAASEPPARTNLQLGLLRS
jgi:hypothetical protein